MPEGGIGTGSLNQERFPAGLDAQGLQLDGTAAEGIAWKYTGRGDAIKAVSAAYQIVAADETIIADAVGGAFTVTLPPVAANIARRFLVKRVNGGANNVTVSET